MAAQWREGDRDCTRAYCAGRVHSHHKAFLTVVIVLPAKSSDWAMHAVRIWTVQVQVPLLGR